MEGTRSGLSVFLRKFCEKRSQACLGQQGAQVFHDVVGQHGLAAAAGGICFAVSDILLGRNRLGKRRSRVRGAAVLILYYLAVYLFALRFWI